MSYSTTLTFWIFLQLFQRDCRPCFRPVSYNFLTGFNFSLPVPAPSLIAAGIRAVCPPSRWENFSADHAVHVINLHATAAVMISRRMRPTRGRTRQIRSERIIRPASPSRTAGTLGTGALSVPACPGDSPLPGRTGCRRPRSNLLSFPGSGALSRACDGRTAGSTGGFHWCASTLTLLNDSTISQSWAGCPERSEIAAIMSSTIV